MTWIERLQTDESLQAFVKAELARGGIELDTLRYQRDFLRRSVQALTEQLETAQTELRKLRRRRGALLEDPDAVAEDSDDVA